MVLAKELVDKLKKIEDFDITYESSDKDSGEIYIDYNNIVFVLEHYIYEGKFYLSGGLHTITYKGKEYYSDVLPYYLDVDYDSDTYNGVDELVSMIEDDIKGCDFKKKLRRLISVVDSIYEDFDDPNGFEQDKLGYLNIRSLQAEAEIETDFEKLYFISSEFDDPLSLDNCATASALVKNGGFYLKNKSNGERQLQSLSKWIHENKADWNEKCLLVFDEVDKGFDLRYQVGLHNMLTNLPVMHGVKILAVSHTLIPMLLEDKVYAFKYRIMLSPSTYVALETGYSIKINDYNEREEV